MAYFEFNAFGILLFIIAIDNISGQNQAFPVINPNPALFVDFGDMDLIAGVNDDGFTGNIPISTVFPFFDRLHNSLAVSTNGVIGPRQVLQYTPDPFPLANNAEMIAPFWADVDLTMNGGRIYYRYVNMQREYCTLKKRCHRALGKKRASGLFHLRSQGGGLVTFASAPLYIFIFFADLAPL